MSRKSTRRKQVAKIYAKDIVNNKAAEEIKNADSRILDDKVIQNEIKAELESNPGKKEEFAKKVANIQVLQEAVFSEQNSKQIVENHKYTFNQLRIANDFSDDKPEATSDI